MRCDARLRSRWLLVAGLLLLLGAPTPSVAADGQTPTEPALTEPVPAKPVPGKAAKGAGVGAFELTNLQVAPGSIIAGGPEKDSIRSVDAPEFATLEKATWVGRETDLVGAALGSEAHAYPVRMLEYHQIVNDVLDGVPVIVTYDPLAGAPFAYKRTVDGKPLVFGVSGLLYNHNLLMFDRATDSLWSQFLGKAIAGPLAGKELERLPVRQETGAAWVSRHPETLVLRHPDPEHIEYLFSPFQSYWIQDRILHPVQAKDERYHAKELVLGVQVGDATRAYLGSIVTREGGSVEDEFGGKKIQLYYDSDTGTYNWEVDEGVKVVESYWFAWKAFHPETEIWRDELPKG